MKNLKLVMIVTLLTFSVVSISNAGVLAGKQQLKATHITFEQALQNQGLVVAMYQQLDASMLQGNLVVRQTLNVTHENIVYRITGTLDQWVMFFGYQVIIGGNKSKIRSSR